MKCSEILKNNKLNSIFRNHGKPSEKKIRDLKKLLIKNNIYNNESLTIKKTLIA